MKQSGKIFLMEKWIQRDSRFIVASIACTLTLRNQCKHLLSQLTLRQSGGFDIPMNSKIDFKLEGDFDFTNISDLKEMHGNNYGKYKLICIKRR